MALHRWLILLACFSTGCGGSGGQSPAAAANSAVCPVSGLTSSAGIVNLQENCTINGDVNLSGSATLTMTGGALSIAGNLALNDNAQFTVTGGNLRFPQATYSQYSVNLNGNSQLALTNSAWITNGTPQNNFSMTLQANDSSVVNFENSTLDTSSGSWLLGNFKSGSSLNVTGSQNLPTEMYPSDNARIAISSDSSFATVWLDFQPGSNATANLPAHDSDGNYNFSFGPGTGIGYSVNISASAGRLGFNSHPDSTVIVNGHGTGADDAAIVFAYYVENSTGPVNIDGLKAGNDITEQFTDQGRTLQLNDVNIEPFSWQVYVNHSNNFPVSVTNSQVNEIGALTGGLVDISNCILQLANTEAAGTGAIMTISGSQIWSQSVLAEDGGKISIRASQLHGNFISASGAGSSISMDDVGDERNGIRPQSCAPIDGLPPNDDGDPLCNPFNPLYQCSQVVPPSGGATITANPSLTCPPQ